MSTLLGVIFWFQAIGVMCKILILGASKYPRTETYSIFVDVVSLVVGMLMAGWIGLYYFEVLK